MTTLLEQRTIEAKLLKSVFDTATQRWGHEQAQQLLEDTVDTISRTNGRELLVQWPMGDLVSFADIWNVFAEGGALQVEFIVRTPKYLHLKIHRCRYAEVYEELGLKDLGFTISCRRDQALVEGYSKNIAFRRTSNIMQGDSCCEFLFTESDS